MKTSDPPIIVEEIINVPSHKVWKAITDLKEMKKWYFENIPAFEPRVGFEVRFDVQNGERIFPHVWKIVEVISNQKIAYHWSSGEAYAGAGIVSFELFEKGASTLIKLTNEIIEDYPDDIPEFRRESCIGGWNYFIKDRLKNYCSNQ